MKKARRAVPYVIPAWTECLFSLVITKVEPAQPASQDSSCKGRSSFANAVKWFLLEIKAHVCNSAALRHPTGNHEAKF